MRHLCHAMQGHQVDREITCAPNKEPMCRARSKELRMRDPKVGGFAINRVILTPKMSTKRDEENTMVER